MPLLTADSTGRPAPDPATGAASAPQRALREIVDAWVVAGADEILLQVPAPLAQRQLAVVGRLARSLTIPLLVRSDTATADELAALIGLGVSRVLIGAAALADPDLISRFGRAFGMEAVGVEIAASRLDGGWRVARGRAGGGTEWDAVTWARVVEAQGGGELVLHSLNGEKGGLDLELVRAVSSAVARPVVAAVAGAAPEDALDAMLIGDADAVLLTGLSAGGESLRRIKRLAAEHGLPVRL